MYFVIHKFPNLSRATIHLGTHSQPVSKRMCRKSFQEMKNMVANEVCRTPIVTFSIIVLFTSKSFIFCHLFNEDGKGPVEFFKGEKLNQTLLNFAPLCFPSIHNLIVATLALGLQLKQRGYKVTEQKEA